MCAAASLVVEGAFTVALGELLFKPPAETRVRGCLARFLRRLPALLFAIVVRELMVVCSLLILARNTIFIPEAMLLEGASFGKALARSRALARNRGGVCFGIWAVRLFLPAFAALALDLLLNGVCRYVLQLGHPTGALFNDGGSGFAVLGALLAVPLAAAMRFLGYVDLRYRFFGVGASAGSAGVSVPIVQKGYAFLPELLYQVAKSTFVGARLRAVRVETALDGSPPAIVAIATNGWSRFRENTASRSPDVSARWCSEATARWRARSARWATSPTCGASARACAGSRRRRRGSISASMSRKGGTVPPPMST